MEDAMQVQENPTVVDYSKYKIFNDSIHGHIELHPLCISIMDTVQFQRLRQIKQLGCCYYVFPGAAHNRFEHSIGVSHLAGKFARTLQARQPDLKITDEDVLCVEIAGLCHDLGHGPFSHVFDAIFIPRIVESKLKHEDATLKLFDHLIKENNLMVKFTDHRLGEKDVTFIKEMMYGPLPGNNETYEGRPAEKKFLYEMVANKRNGIDVDKWDYFARDCHMLGIANNFDHNRYMKFARVIEVDGQYQICMRDKEKYNVFDMFHTRDGLHRRAYQHNVTKGIELMIVDALELAKDYPLIRDKTGKKCTMSAIIHDMIDDATTTDMTAYTNMTDNIMYQLLDTTEADPKLQQSRDIINNVLSRKLYTCIGQASPKQDGTRIDRAMIPGMNRELVRLLPPGITQPNASDLVILVVTFSYGMKSANPIDNVRFYSKGRPKQAYKIPENKVSKMLTKTFSEEEIRVYCKDNESVATARKCFDKWCEKNNYELKDRETTA